MGVGGGIVDRLKEQDYRVHGYNGGRSPKRPTFANLRAESHWHLRTLLEQGQIALPYDEELFDELVAIRWRATSNGKIQIEPKEELEKTAWAIRSISRRWPRRRLGRPGFGCAP